MREEGLSKFKKINVSPNVFDGELKLSVSARDLWQALGSRQDFSHWIKKRIRELELVENRDFFSFDKIIERATGGSTRIEYVVTLNAAKHMAQIEKTEVGHAVRQYLIDAEEELQRVRHLPAVVQKADNKIQAILKHRADVYELLKHEMKISRYVKGRKLSEEERLEVARNVQEMAGESVYADCDEEQEPVTVMTESGEIAVNVTNLGLWLRHYEKENNYDRPRKVNRMLIAFGLQDPVMRNGRITGYIPSEVAIKNELIHQYPVAYKRRDKGTMQLLWYPERTVDYIEKLRNRNDLAASAVIPHMERFRDNGSNQQKM